jgi:hypothetical protein
MTLRVVQFEPIRESGIYLSEMTCNDLEEALKPAHTRSGAAVSGSSPRKPQDGRNSEGYPARYGQRGASAATGLCMISFEKREGLGDRYFTLWRVPEPTPNSYRGTIAVGFRSPPNRILRGRAC